MLFLSSIMSPCFVCVLVRCRSDLSASAVLYAHDRYCRGLGRVLVLIIHTEQIPPPRGKTDRHQANARTQPPVNCQGVALNRQNRLLEQY